MLLIVIRGILRSRFVTASPSLAVVISICTALLVLYHSQPMHEYLESLIRYEGLTTTKKRGLGLLERPNFETKS